MKSNLEFYCTDCGERQPINTLMPRCQCGGLWKLDYSPNFDLNRIDRDEWSIFRYREFMGIEGESWRDVTLGEGMTPIIKYSDDVLLKMDYFMPTLSFKDRGAAVLISNCKAIGVDYVVQDSSGNAGNSIAAYSARAGIKCEIFVPEGTSPKKIDMIRSHGAVCTVAPGSRDNCADVCREKVEREGVYYANHVYNPLFYEGTKTYIYETYEQLGKIPENILIPVGNGTLFIGVIKGLEDLVRAGCIDKMPNLIAFQTEGCDPIVGAAELDLKEPIETVGDKTIAEGIAIGRPMRGKEILEYAYKYDVKFVHAPEDRILEARKELALNGIYCEHTTAANYAAYWKYCELYGPTKDVLITMCGAGLKSDH